MVANFHKDTLSPGVMRTGIAKHLCALAATCLLLALCLMSPLATATTGSQAASLLLKRSNINKQIETLPGTLIQALQRGGKQTVSIPSSLINTLTEAVQASFVVEELRTKLLQQVDQQLNEKELKQLLAWYNSDLGKKIVRAEASAASPENMHDMLQNAQSLLTDRRVLPYIAEIDNALEMADFTIRLQNLTQRAIFEASSIGLRPSDPIDVSLFDQQWASQTAQIEAATNQLMTLTYSYSYQNLSDQELMRYTTFLKSSAAQKFNQIVKTEIEALFKASSQRMVQYVANKPKRNPLAY